MCCLKCFKKARHYQSKLRFLQDCYQEGLVEFHQTKTEHMTADLFTKALRKREHWKHTSTMLKELPEHVIEENPTRYTPFIIMRYSGLVMQLNFLILIYLIMHTA